MRDVLLELLGHPERLAAMRRAKNPYGDGQAGKRIAQAIGWHFGLEARPDDWRP